MTKPNWAYWYSKRRRGHYYGTTSCCQSFVLCSNGPAVDTSHRTKQGGRMRWWRCDSSSQWHMSWRQKEADSHIGKSLWNSQLSGRSQGTVCVCVWDVCLRRVCVCVCVCVCVFMVQAAEQWMEHSAQICVGMLIGIRMTLCVHVGL